MIYIVERKQIDGNRYWDIELIPKGCRKGYTLQPSFECLSDAVCVANCLKQLDDEIKIQSLNFLPHSLSEYDLHILPEFRNQLESEGN